MQFQRTALSFMCASICLSIACKDKSESPLRPITAAGSGGSAGTAAGQPTAPPPAGNPAPALAGRGAGAGGAAGAPVIVTKAGSGGAGMPAGTGAGAGAGAGGAAGGGMAGASSGMAGAGGSSGAQAGASGAAAGSGGAGGAGGAQAGACGKKPGSKRGKSEQTLMVGRARRSFVHYAPATLDPDKPVPLVIVPHGYTQSGEAMFTITKYPALADREGFVVMFPDGAPNSTGPWDVGSGVCGNGALVPGSGDDQAFVDAMIEFAQADQCIDREHIFMTGWSMGGYLSHHSGCLRDDIRAIGPHSAGTHDLAGCKAKPKPVIMFHFDPDGLIDYSCGTRARDGWLKRNGCQAADPDVTMVKGGSCAYYKGCPAGAQVAFCTFDIPLNHRADFLAGHAWSGGSVHSYSIAETESAAELGWTFFKKYAW